MFCFVKGNIEASCTFVLLIIQGKCKLVNANISEYGNYFIVEMNALIIAKQNNNLLSLALEGLLLSEMLEPFVFK